jgi:hypothetical protein
MAAPELKQFGEPELEDFERHPVWIGCHTADYGKPWYDDTDEETFRPYAGKLPADPSEGMLLVRAVFEIKDGTRYQGFVTPATEAWDTEQNGRPPSHILGIQQPQMFASDRIFGFWGGMLGISPTTQRELFAAIGKRPDSIFPVRFYADTRFTTGVGDGKIEGFYRRDVNGTHITIADPAPDVEVIANKLSSRTWFSIGARAYSGYPQPENNFQFLKIVYENACPRCGIFDRQIAHFV